ncbi:MAG: PDZ domain-containing protein, partial [Bacteroidota bacterium]
QSCCVGPTCFSNVITNFQTLNPQQDTSFLNGRNGLMGSILLQRFVIYIDYVGGRLFLRPGKRAQRRFRFDRSGLGIIASGEKLDEFIVQQVLNGSPSAESGVQVGDKILRINGLPARMITLPGIVRRLQKKRSKKIKLTIEREGQIHKLQFRLRDLI